MNTSGTPENEEPADEEPDEAQRDPRDELRELLAQMPLFEIESNATAVEQAAERVVIDEWAAKTAELARRLGRQDIELRVVQIMEGLDRVDDRADAATQRRREATTQAEDVLRDLDEQKDEDEK
jgi:hypothetical protein